MYLFVWYYGHSSLRIRKCIKLLGCWIHCKLKYVINSLLMLLITSEKEGYIVYSVEQAEGSVMLDELMGKTKKYAIVMGNEVSECNRKWSIIRTAALKFLNMVRNIHWMYICDGRNCDMGTLYSVESNLVESWELKLAALYIHAAHSNFQLSTQLKGFQLSNLSVFHQQYHPFSEFIFSCRIIFLFKDWHRKERRMFDRNPLWKGP